MFKDFIKNIKIVKYVFKFCPFYIIYTLLNIACNVIGALSKVYIIKDVIEKVVAKVDFINIFNSLLIYIVIIAVTSIFGTIYSSFISSRYRIIYVNKMQNYMFSLAKKIDYADFDNPTFYDSYSRALRDGTTRGIRVYEDFTSLLTSIANTIAIGTFIVVNDVYLILLIIASIVITIIANIRINKLSYVLDKNTEKDRRMHRYINRVFYQQKYAAEVKTTPISNLLIERYYKARRSMNKEYIRIKKKSTLWSFLQTLMSVLLENIGIYIYLGYNLFITKLLSIAMFTSMLNAVKQFSSNFSTAANFVYRIKLNAMYIDDFLWFMDYKGSLETFGTKEIVEKFKFLNIDNISFSYPETDKFSLKNINLEISQGEKLAIVGLNGAGKTTLIKLLLKFYNPTIGDIYYNDDIIRDVKEDDIRGQYAIVFQDFQLYAANVAENVLMRKIESNDDEKLVFDSLEKVGLKEKIIKLKEGIYTQVTREFDIEGITFSGGERQRLAISRVFASSAPIIILDEPTSALDPLAEKEINQLIINNAENKTIIIIAHRLSTVCDADKIILIENGSIIESGTHNELMNKNGKYNELFSTQAALYRKMSSK